MNVLKPVLFLALTCGLTACAASSDTSEVSKSKTITPIATVKPGADVSLNSVLPKSMTSGAFQTVQLRLQDGYADGPLSVNLSTSDGLRLFGGATSKTFDMSQTGPHVWDVDVKADVDGVYFLNVFAEADGQPRSFSVRIDMGVVTQKMFDDAMPADGVMADGGKIRVLDADETIK